MKVQMILIRLVNTATENGQAITRPCTKVRTNFHHPLHASALLPVGIAVQGQKALYGQLFAQSLPNVCRGSIRAVGSCA